MTLQRDLVCLSVSLEDRRDELKQALALFDSGISQLDESGFSRFPDRQLQDRGLYLLGLYHREVSRILEQLDADIDGLKQARKLLI